MSPAPRNARSRRDPVPRTLSNAYRRPSPYCTRVMADRVYLAGPPFAEEYRRRAALLLRGAGLEPVDPMRRDFRGNTTGQEAEIVEGDLEDIRGCEAILAAFTAPDEGTAMEAWYAHSLGKRVVAYTGGTPPHPWTVYVADAIYADPESAVRALAETDSGGSASDQVVDERRR